MTLQVGGQGDGAELGNVRKRFADGKDLGDELACGDKNDGTGVIEAAERA